MVVISLAAKYRKFENDLAGAIKALLFYLKRPSAYFEVFLVSDDIIRRLNRVFKKKDKATNVLSFPFKDFPHPDKLTRPLGEIYLAPDYIKKHGESLEALVVHGLLHLLGYTHKNRHDRIKMERLEKKLFAKINLV